MFSNNFKGSDVARVDHIPGLEVGMQLKGFGKCDSILSTTTVILIAGAQPSISRGLEHGRVVLCLVMLLLVDFKPAEPQQGFSEQIELRLHIDTTMRVTHWEIE